MTLKLLTLTYKDDVTKPKVLRTFAHFVQDIRRHYGTFEYARFPQKTKRGRIHLHLVVMCPYIPQKDISKRWRVATKGSYICDIRVIHEPGRIARYVTRYLTKEIFARVTYSRGFPNFADLEMPDPATADPEQFTYRYMDVNQSLVASGGAPQLWTGEPCYPNGKCECFKRHEPREHGPPYLDAIPHPIPEKRRPSWEQNS